MPASVHEDQDQSMVDVDAQQENGEVIEVGENRITIVCSTLSQGFGISTKRKKKQLLTD